MEQTKKQANKAPKKTNSDSIKLAYVHHLLTHGERPASVFKFCLELGISEDEFYAMYGSFDSVEKDVWNGYITKTISRLEADVAYKEFSARERVLSFYFTLLEELRANRSFVLLQLENFKQTEMTPPFLSTFRKKFEEFFDVLLFHGKQNGEVATRPFLDNRYPTLFWLHMAFVLNFWKRDDSPNFEKTDAAIEKSVNLAFDLIGKGALDSALDFGKFLYQNR